MPKSNRYAQYSPSTVNFIQQAPSETEVVSLASAPPVDESIEDRGAHPPIAAGLLELLTSPSATPATAEPEVVEIPLGQTRGNGCIFRRGQVGVTTHLPHNHRMRATDLGSDQRPANVPELMCLPKAVVARALQRLGQGEVVISATTGYCQGCGAEHNVYASVIPE